MKSGDTRLRPTVYVDSIPELAALRSRQRREETRNDRSHAAHRDDAVTPRDDDASGAERGAARCAA